jgi:hypothetical protein
MHRGPAGNWLVLNNFDKFGNNSNYRINFKKSRLNKDRTIFSETLPFIPYVTDNLWFTNSSKNLEKIDLSKLSENDKKSVLKLIYDGVYTSGSNFQIVINGKSTVFDVNTDIITKPRFEVNYQKFISGVVNNFMKYQSVPVDMTDNFDDLFLDLTSNIVYNKDETGLYQMINGNKVYYDVDRLQNDLQSNCYGTYINDENSCSVVQTCILNNNPQNLVRCLDYIRSEDLFNVAKSDIKSINPEIMRNIIKTFGFDIRKETDGVYRPRSMQEWMNSNSIPSEIKELIQNNKKLRIYIGEILNIIRSNPIVLKENSGEERREYSKMGLNYFVQPVQLERPIHNENIYRNMLLKTNMPTSFDLPFFANLNNVGIQSGGVSDVVTKEMGDRTSEKLKRLFDSMFKELVNSGKELKDEDKLRIYNIIEQVGKFEAQLNTLYEEIQMYANINKMMQDTNTVEKTELSEIHDFTNNKQKIEEAYDNIRKKYQKTMQNQFQLVNALYMAQIPLVRMIGFYP